MTIHRTATDRYPTRRTAVPHLLPREDPVFWGDPAAGPLSPEAAARYEENGYHTVRDFFSPDEVALCAEELVRLGGDPMLDGDDRVILEAGAGDVRSVFEIHRLSGPVRELLTSAKVLDMARQILGSEVYVHQSRINYKPGFGGGPFYWHSDFETWHAEDGMPEPRAFSMSIALTENHPSNGPLMIIPGSHRTFVTCVGETPADHFRQSLSSHDPQIGMPDRESVAALAERRGITQFTGPPGSATVFDANCMHGSNGNITPFPRSNVFVVFNSVENALVEPFAAPEPRPHFIAARDFTPAGA